MAMADRHFFLQWRRDIFANKAQIFACLVSLFLWGCASKLPGPAKEEINIPVEPAVEESKPARPEPVLTHVKSIRGTNINSPKAAIFSPDGSRFYINSLEGMKTAIFDSQTLKELGVIEHSFTEADSPLFAGNEDRIEGYEYFTLPKNGQTNCFGGKPVEFALSHNGKYLWITYYRKSWDPRATSPSAVAIIDLDTNKPVRIMPTGTIPKMLTLSPDGNTMAIINWGDNTIGLIDVSASDPKDFKYIRQMTDGSKLDLERTTGDRDANCGYCLRGAAFSPDSRYLLVGRMHGGGISVFDTRNGERIGILRGFPATPRHLVRDGSKLYVSSNASGYVSEIDLTEALKELLQAPGKDNSVKLSPRTLFVGKGTRTILLTPDGKYILAVSNLASKLSLIDRDKWKVVAQLPVSQYGVGLAVSPDGKMAVTTSQGRQGHGGHVIDVFALN